MSKRDDERMAEEDFNRVEDIQRALKKMVKPVTCPLCQCQVKVVGVPNKKAGIIEIKSTTIVRQSSLEECPRCNCGKKQVERNLIEEAKRAERQRRET